jgi:regulatory protein
MVTKAPKDRIVNRFGSVQPMLPHGSSGDATPHGRGRRKNQPLDFAWLEERALRYAARWETTAAGVATLLERKILERCERTGESPDLGMEMIPRLVAQLIERGYVDDRRFAAGALERARRQGESTARIRARLTTKGISRSLIDELLDEEAPEIEIRCAWRLARRRRIGPYCEDPAERRASRDRHLGVLSRQGFEHEIALQIVDADRPPESL